jgi:hypothetical protein
MTKINWHPSPAEMRRWARTTALALGVAGSLFYFVDWGIFSGGQRFGIFLWSFSAVAFGTGITGTKLGLPAYWAWMGFVWSMSRLIGHAALAATYFLVVTPLAVIAHLVGRDRLQLRKPQGGSLWQNVESGRRHDSERQF